MAWTDQAGSWRFAGREVREGSRELLVDGRPVPLERKPFEVLLCLLRHAGEVVTREELTEQVWAGRIVTDSVLSRTVLKLRKALGDEDRAIIDTVHGYGYRLVAPVERSTAQADEASRLNLREGTAVPQRPHFLLQYRLGTGGYGEVWLARHEKTGDPRVFKFCNDSRELYALKREVTVYRLLKKSLGPREDVVRVFDWEFTEPPFFIEMEHVDGGSLLDYDERHGGLGAVPIARRIEIVARVAETLDASHAVGVLHKDVKPANILVSEDGEGNVRTRLTDFGSGYLLDPDRLSELGITRAGFTKTASGTESSTSGTPLYLAPEVAAGQPPTIQSDVYSLGVLLYQVLAGDFSRPLAAGWEADIDDELLREDIARAANVEPGRRLRSAGDLAQRLRSLEARRESLELEQARSAEAERAEKALERAAIRRRWLGALLAVSVTGAAVSLGLYWQARQASEEARREAEVARTVAQFLNEDLLAQSDPVLGGSAGLTVREALDRAVMAQETELTEVPAVRAEVLAVMGRAYARLGAYEEAEQLVKEARGLAQSEQIDDPLLLFRITRTEAELETGRGQNDRARALFDRLLAGDAWKNRIPSRERAETRLALARLLRQEGDREGAVALLGDLLSQVDRLSESGRELKDRVRIELGFTLDLMGRAEEAEALARAAHESLAERLGPEHPLTINARNNRASALASLGRFEEAEAIYSDVVSLATERYGSDHPFVAAVAHDFGVYLMSRGDNETALPWMRQAYEARRARLEPAHSLRLASTHNLGVIHRRIGNVERAEVLLKEATSNAEAGLGEAHPDTLTSTATLANLYRRTDRLPEARRLLEHVIALAPEAFPEGGFWVGHFHDSLGQVYQGMGKNGLATDAYSRALDIYTESIGPEHPTTKAVREDLAQLGSG